MLSDGFSQDSVTIIEWLFVSFIVLFFFSLYFRFAADCDFSLINITWSPTRRRASSPVAHYRLNANIHHRLHLSTVQS